MSIFISGIQELMKATKKNSYSQSSQEKCPSVSTPSPSGSYFLNSCLDLSILVPVATLNIESKVT